MEKQKELIVVAGPNGCGKTTFALEYVAQHGMMYLGADLIAEELSPGKPFSARFQAGRQFLSQVNSSFQGSESLLIETTLSGVGFRNALGKARRSGFTISIVYLYVDSAETCIARIQERVRKGGHHVPETDVRRRFGRSLHNFWNVYREFADQWLVLYNAEEQVQDVTSGSRGTSRVHNTQLFADFMELVRRFDDE